MPEENNYIRIPVADCKVTATIDISEAQGIKALYCGDEKKVRTYLFDTNRWTMAEAKRWVEEHSKTEASKMAESFQIPVSDGHAAHKTRRLPISESRGINADYCLACDAIISYHFSDAWDEDAAREWIASNAPATRQQAGAFESAVSKLESLMERLAELLGVQRATAARVGDYQVQGFHSEFGKADEGEAWSFDAADGNALTDKGGWALFKKCHLVCEGDGTPEKKAAYTYPVAKLVGGSPKYFLKAAQAVYAGLRGGARGADLPSAVNEACLRTVKAIYKTYGRDTSDMTLSLALEVFIQERLDTGVLPVFELSQEVRGGPVVNDRGWIKKTILRTGEWTETPPGGDKPLQVTLALLKMIEAAFNDGAFERVPVSLGHGDTAWVTEHTKAYVRALEIGQLDDGQYSLDAWLDFTDPDTEKSVRLGNIWNCSVALKPVTRPSDGKHYPVALWHLALTNYPWVEGLPGFVEASRDTVKIRYRKEENHDGRSEMEISTEQQEALEALAQAGLTPGDVVSLARQRDEVEQTRAQLEQERLQLARQEHEGWIGQVVLALEGKHNLDGVVSVDGYRHYPAVVKRVEEVLTSLPPGAEIQLARDGDKKEGIADLVLGVVNAIPQEGRISLSQPEVGDHARNVEKEPEEITPDDITDEEIEKLAEK